MGLEGLNCEYYKPSIYSVLTVESPTHLLTLIPFGSNCHQSTRAKITHTHTCVLLTATAFTLEGSHGSESVLCIKVPAAGADGDANRP